MWVVLNIFEFGHYCVPLHVLVDTFNDVTVVLYSHLTSSSVSPAFV